MNEEEEKLARRLGEELAKKLGELDSELRDLFGVQVNRYFIDDAGNPVPEPDLMKWAQWMGTHERHVAKDMIDDHYRVSTVFLGLNHNYFPSGDPILWETMVFDEKHKKTATNPINNEDYEYAPGLEQERYSSKEAAIAGHFAMVEKYINMTEEEHDKLEERG